MAVSTRLRLIYLVDQSNRVSLVLLAIFSVIGTIHSDSKCTQLCVNGNCDKVDNCVCNPCWTGKYCNQPDERYQIQFKEKVSRIYISQKNLKESNLIYTAQALNPNLLRCDSLQRCPCAEVEYQLGGHDASLFELNNTSGELKVLNHARLQLDHEYHLTMTAVPKWSLLTQKDTLTIKVILLEHLNRIKRQAQRKKSNDVDDNSGKVAEAFPTSFGLRTVSGEVNSLQVGNSIHYKLEIALPRATLDLILEIYTRDLSPNLKNSASLSLYNFSIPQRVPGISFNSPEPKFYLSNKTQNVFDKLIVDFGSIKNTGPERNTFTIYFSVILIRKPGKETKHSVAVGAEYSKGTLVWVAQSQITTTSLSQSDDQVFSEVEIDELPQVPLDSAAMYHMKANLEFRSDRFRVEISKESHEYEPDNLLSLGYISVYSFGSNYQAIPNDARQYTSYRNRTVSSFSFSRSVLDMGVITNTGDKSRTFTKNPNNIIEFVFTVYALNFNENIGKNASFTVKYFMGAKNIYSKTLNVTISDRKSERVAPMLLGSQAYFMASNVSKGGLIQLKVRSEFAVLSAPTAFADYTLLVEVPMARRTPLFVPCAARFLNQQSGPNLAYLNAIHIKPQQQEDSNQFAFNLGRIHFVKLYNHSVAEDNVVVAEIVFRVPFHYEIDEGTTLYANIKVSSGYKNQKVNMEKNEVTVFSEQRDSQVQLWANSSVKWSELVVGGGVALSLHLQLPTSSAFQTLRLSVSRDTSTLSTPNLPELHICKLTVVSVDQDMPCTCVMRDTINQNQTLYTRVDGKPNQTLYDQATIDFGPISMINDQSEESFRDILANFAAIIQSSSAIEQEVYPVRVEIMAENQVLESQILNLTILQNASAIDERIHEMSARLRVKLLESKPIRAGFTTNIAIEVWTSPNTMGPLSIEVFADDEEVSICGLWIEDIGANMPCVVKDTKAEYEFIVHGHNNQARLTLDTVTNFGSNRRQSAEEERLANTLHFISMVRVGESVKTDKTIRVVLTYGYREERVVESLIIPVDTTSEKLIEYRQPKSVTMVAANQSNVVYAGMPTLIYFDIELEENSQTPITILMDASNDYKVCAGAITAIGKNYPCYSPNSLKQLSGKFQLGMICNTFLIRDQLQDNTIRLAVALRPSDQVTQERQFKVSSLAYIGQIPFNRKNELLMTVSAERWHSGSKSGKGATVHAEASDSIGIKIRERKWVAFNVRIPPHSSGMLRVAVHGDADGSRAMVVLRDLRLVAGGDNLPCPLDNPPPRLHFNSTTDNSQPNMIVADLGYFSNFAFANYMKRQNESDKLRNDFLKIEVLAELTDHPSIVEEGAYQVSLTTYYGDADSPVVREGKAKLVRLAEEEPNPQIDVNIKLKKKLDVLDRGDTLTLTATLKHLPESNAEPLNPVLRLFTPKFIEIIQIDSANTKEKPTLVNTTNGIVDIAFPWILFTDEIVLNFTIQIDPKNIRGYGREEVLAITPYRVMCEHVRLSANSKFPCSHLKHISFRSKSSECDLPLGMESGEITDAQLSASSAINANYAPYKARPNSRNFWSPAMSNDQTEHFLQIDFRRKTRVVRLDYKSIRGLRRVTEYHMMYSNDGRIWRASNNATFITYNGDDGESTIKTPIEARFIRFVIDEIDTGKKTKNQYVAVRIELYGCYLESEVANETLSYPTHFSDNTSAVNRHISVDPYTNVAYFCDATSGGGGQLCYYSDSGGQSWHVVGRSIDSVEGFELASGKFFAVDFHRPAYFFSGNGLSWTPIDFEEFNRTVSHPKFQKKVIVPQFHKDDIRKMNLRLGNWRVIFDGLSYEDSQYPRAYWKKCCGLN